MGGKGAKDPQDEDVIDDSEVRERDLVEAYVQDHALEEQLNEVINQVVADRPADPFLVLSSLLYGRATAKRGIFHVECKEVLDATGLPGVLVRLHTGKGVFEASCSSQIAGLVDRPDAIDEFAPTIPLHKQRYGGQGYKLRAAKAQQALIDKLLSMEPTDQSNIDSILLLLEPEIGRNFCLATSITVCKAGAKYKDLPVHEYIATLCELPVENVCIPMPLFSLINGGKLASTKLFIQEIFVTPASATSFQDALQLGAELNRSLASQLESRGVGFRNLGTFGGYAPQLQTIAETFQILRAAVEETTLRIDGGGGDSLHLLDSGSVSPLRFEFGIDFAASEFVTPAAPLPVAAATAAGDSDHQEEETMARTTFTYNTDKWVPGSMGVIQSSDDLLDTIQSCIHELQVVAVVDPFDKGDLKAFASLMSTHTNPNTNSHTSDDAAEAEAAAAAAAGSVPVGLGGDATCTLQVIARDLVDVHGLETIHDEQAANTILLELGQFPTITKALERVTEARRYGLAVVLGRGGGGGDGGAFLVAFAAGTGMGQVKFGGLMGSASVNQYNQLLLLADGGGDSNAVAPPAFVGAAYRR